MLQFPGLKYNCVKPWLLYMLSCKKFIFYQIKLKAFIVLNGLKTRPDQTQKMIKFSLFCKTTENDKFC
jgi:hypothetical protein